MPVGQGLKSGAFAWIGGLVLIFVFMQLLGDVVAAVSSAFPIASAAYVYSFLHGWPMVYGMPPTALVFSLIPIAILIASGYSAAQKTSGGTTNAAKRGASIVAGYFVLVLVSVLYIFVRAASLVSDVTGTSTASAATETASGTDFGALLVILLFTGVVFPAVFGALGGIIAEKRGY